MLSALAMDEEDIQLAACVCRTAEAGARQRRRSDRRPPASGPRSARHRRRRIRWRRRAPILLAAGLLVAAVGVLAFNLPRRGTSSERLAGSHTQVTNKLAAEAAARKEAVTWILEQVSRAAVVSCDPQVCADLVSARLPVREPVDARAHIERSARLCSGGRHRAHPSPVQEPAGLRLRPGHDRELRLRDRQDRHPAGLPGGAARYGAVRRTALRARKAADAQLLANSQIAASATARAQLLRGDIDPRLPQLLAIMAESHPVHIVDFINQSPGGGPASLLRSVDLATVDSTAHLTRAAYLGWMQAFIDAQRAQYHPAWVQQVTLHTGQTLLRSGMARRARSAS